ncbi:DNA polymerase [Fusobacterium ulcerans]|uniref:DNA polymerase n=1 Tax=Fusobacterium ulcerans TaxID=861 RepID=UPI002E79847B|nr:DNA polymerase [Fusobacterium ulcerans]MEE0137738.1 hypothetical protein [Fusobacterium ulcerans]
MLYWNKYNGVGHEPNIKGKRKFYDNNIYTFDIETSSYFELDGKIYPAIKYDNLSEKEKQRCIKRSHMYIWMFGINDIVYFGRTWEELKLFLKRLDDHIGDTKYVFIHNLAFEFQYLKSNFHFDDVQARKSHKVITAIMRDYNIILKCSYMMSNVGLKYLPKMFDLPVEKKVGDLDYDLIRNPNTPMSEKELGYCEYDCLVLYHYILKELEVYEDVKHIPTTNTGKVRRELQELIRTNFKYKRVVHKAINTDPIIYNRLCEAFLGGYTHANWIYADEVLKNVDSYDIASSYPYVLVTQKYPNSEFRKCKIRKREDMSKRLAYLLVVRFKNVRCKYYNNFISSSKCRNLRGAKYDNGRLISADEFEITLTDIDFYFYLDTYDCEYEILECYYSSMSYLPKTLIEFILDKYVGKTELKGVEGREMEYGRIKGMYNSIYGMSVTNNIRDDVIYDDSSGIWSEVPLTNEDIIEKLKSEKKKSFLSFAYGVWVTAYARDNLLRRVIANDDYVVYCDTDSCKLVDGYDKNVFLDYNKQVSDRIAFVCRVLKLDSNKYAPSDIKGNKHMMGLFEKECNYEEFITQGAKKYAYKIDGKIHITVAGIPKKGSSALKSLDDFRDDFVFSYKDTNKNLVMYTEEQSPIEVLDYLGLKYLVTDKSGCCILPNTYKLSKSLDYANLISDDSSKRARYKEE